MNLSTVMPFQEAVQSLAEKQIFPTTMTTAQLQTLSAEARRSSLFSAQTTLNYLLQSYYNDLLTIINPTAVERADRITEDNPTGLTTEGLNFAQARLNAKQLLDEYGYEPNEDERGTIQDLSSDARINLVLETNAQVLRGAGQFIQGNDPDVIEAFPCWELVRFQSRHVERKWNQRWKLACEVAGDATSLGVMEKTKTDSAPGRMVARKDSAVWQALGDGAGGYQDGLGNPFPPFAFNSGMGVLEVSFDDSQALGLVDLQTKVQPQTIDFGKILPLQEAA